MMIPESYEEWHRCITVNCGLTLTTSYIDERLKALRNPKDPATKRFCELYGHDQLEQTISWFERARAGAASP